MNEINNPNTLHEAEISAVVDAYVYMNKWDKTYDPKSNNEFLTLEELCAKYDGQNLSKEARTYLDVIKNSIKSDSSIGELRLISHSVSDGKISDDLLIACAFADKDGNIYFSYRGTGHGKWLDNGDAMSKVESQMQACARDYFDSVIEKHNLENYTSGKIILTGHSKGGNSAQFVSMTSKYAHLIDNCYSFDGQGFSSEAIVAMQQAFRNKYGENWELEFNKQISKLYSINGENDYVHELGKVIIGAENTFYIKITASKEGPMEWHSLNWLFSDEGINWEFTEQGPVGKFASEISSKLMSLDNENLDDCAITIMYLLECFIGGGEGSGDRKIATTEEITGFINVGIPLIINTIRESDSINDVLNLMGIEVTKDHWLAEPLFDILIDISEDMTIDELEGYINLGKEISNYAKEHGMSTGDLINYIKEDPLRLIEIYSSMDMSQKSLHEAICKIFAPKNIARIAGAFAKEHPMMTASAVAALSNPMIRGALISVASFIVVGGTIYLIANHIIVNWDSIKEAIIQGAEYVKDKIAEMYTALVNKINEEINEYVADVLATVEKIITVGERVIDFAGDKIEDFMGFMKDACKVAIKTLFMLSNPILYLIASKLYNSTREPVRINMVKLRQCVNTMNRLASRVASIDSRLDNLYYQLSRNNIEQGEGIFTSLANMYNLFRADLNVDEGQAIKRKARALSELFEDCEKTDKWVTSNVPQRI